ncbi:MULTISPECIES: ROK family protein [Bacillota]|uniref:ROK family protein n=1 Tax=Clostridium nitritogenes TaxID=83340 RepID=A0ABP3WV42_9CLOT|nr:MULTISPECIES: ROK family protein [Bacillota]MBT9832203.1 ROK family protein [Clostridium baratii]MDU1829577.1 ROK family protein [Anaerococcus sp.]MDY3208795.1 ROK family protein [Clostridium baratii]
MFACLDIGGTSIKVALSDKDGNLIEKDTLYPSHELKEFTNTIVNWVNGMKNQYDIKGVAISSPGAVDTNSGIVGGASAVPCIHGPNWKEILSERLNLNISIENDANCVALAEIFSGSAKEVNDILFVVCGSGIGGSIIKDKKIHHGKHLYGGEFGFMIMEDNDGEYKTFSEIASTMSFVRKARKHFNDESLDGKDVFNKAENGDEFCKEIIDRFYSELAKGIYNLQYMYDPELILIGGAISDRDDFVISLNEKIDNILEKIKIAEIKPEIRTCTHRKDANLIGALAHHIKEYNI